MEVNKRHVLRPTDNTGIFLGVMPSTYVVEDILKVIRGRGPRERERERDSTRQLLSSTSGLQETTKVWSKLARVGLT